MDPVIAMMVIPLLIWAGVFWFMQTVDRRARDLERRVRLHEGRAAANSGHSEGAANR
jgi:hypothetical protein